MSKRNVIVLSFNSLNPSSADSICSSAILAFSNCNELFKYAYAISNKITKTLAVCFLDIPKRKMFIPRTMNLVMHSPNSRDSCLRFGKYKDAIFLLFFLVVPTAFAQLNECPNKPEFQKTDCLIRNAISIGNVGICETVGKYRGFCYYLFAAHFEDPTLCKRADSFSGDCYFNITIQTHNIEYCNYAKAKSNCVIEAALFTKDVSYCNHSDNYEECLNEFGKVHPFSRSCLYSKENSSDCLCTEDEYLDQDRCIKLLCSYDKRIENHQCEDICPHYKYYKDGKCYMKCFEGYVSTLDGEDCRMKTTLYIKENMPKLKIPSFVVLTLILFFLLQKYLPQGLSYLDRIINWKLVVLMILLLFYFIMLFFAVFF